MKFPRSASGPGHDPFRGFLALLMMVYMQVIMLFVVMSQILGGTPEAVQNQKYFLSNHGKQTEVTFQIWKIMGIAGWSAFVACICLFLTVSTCIFLLKKKYAWYLSMQNYTYPVMVIFITCMLLIFLAALAPAV